VLRPARLTPPFFFQERRRTQAHLEKLRHGISLLDKQLDALRASELDKELMSSLRASSQAMRQAGIGAGVQEAESVMTELDEHIREASELTSVLATPLVDTAAGPMLEDEYLNRELDEELGVLEESLLAPPTPPPSPPPVLPPREPFLPPPAPVQVSRMSADW
jgi:hypothetical protein